MELKCPQNQLLQCSTTKRSKKKMSMTMEPKCSQNQLLHCSITKRSKKRDQ